MTQRLPPISNPSNAITVNVDLNCILACREFDVSKQVMGTSGKSEFGVSGVSGPDLSSFSGVDKELHLASSDDVLHKDSSSIVGSFD